MQLFWWDSGRPLSASSSCPGPFLILPHPHCTLAHCTLHAHHTHPHLLPGLGYRSPLYRQGRRPRRPVKLPLHWPRDDETPNPIWFLPGITGVELSMQHPQAMSLQATDASPLRYPTRKPRLCKLHRIPRPCARITTSSAPLPRSTLVPRICRLG